MILVVIIHALELPLHLQTIYYVDNDVREPM
jgi:hypothetical protein